MSNLPDGHEKKIRKSELKKFWWWRGNAGWQRICETRGGGAEDQDAKRWFERAAFTYEAKARTQKWSKRPNWEHGKPFCDLTFEQIEALEEKYPSMKLRWTGIGIGTTEGKLEDGYFTLSGIHICPGKTTLKQVLKNLSREIEKRAREANLKWKKSPLTGYRSAKFPWERIEQIDQANFGNRPAAGTGTDPEGAARHLLERYSQK